MATVVGIHELPRDGNSYEFQGYRHGDAPVSFILVDMPPGAHVMSLPADWYRGAGGRGLIVLTPGGRARGAGRDGGSASPLAGRPRS
jgi:hypothetical protein